MRYIDTKNWVLAFCFVMAVSLIGRSICMAQSGYPEQVAAWSVGGNSIHHIQPSGSAAS